MHRLHRLIIIVTLILTACGAEAAPQAIVTTEIISTETPPPLLQAPTVVPTMTFTPSNQPLTLGVWWPESFAPANNNEALAVLSGQINTFQATQNGVVVNMRLKKETDVGGIMSTLLTASAVAPGALPDVTLIRRHDLLDAVQAGVIYPLEGKISSAVVGDLYDAALQLGQVEGTLYGVPYTVEIQHTAYHRTQEIETWNFENLLEDKIRFVFPAGKTNGVNNVFLVEYIDAGGTLPATGETGLTTINEQALLDTLTFYEDMLTNGTLDAAMVNYTAPTDYINLLVDGGADAGIVTSTTYLQLLEAGKSLEFAPIPTQSGALITEVDGWIWVMTTSNADRQLLAAQFLNWMLNADRQGEYTQILRMLPSQRTALQQWEPSPYSSFARDLLANAMLPLASSGALERAMQNALVAVLTGQSTAQQATAAVMNQLAATAS